MAEKNTVLVPLTGTIVIREGKRVRPIIGSAFEYTDSEVADLKAAGAKFRKPENETVTAPAATTDSSKGKAPKKESAEKVDAKKDDADADKKADAKKADKDDDL